MLKYLQRMVVGTNSHSKGFISEIKGEECEPSNLCKERRCQDEILTCVRLLVNGQPLYECLCCIFIILRLWFFDLSVFGIIRCCRCTSSLNTRFSFSDLTD